MNFSRGWTGDREFRGGPLTSLLGSIATNLPREAFYLGAAQQINKGIGIEQEIKADIEGTGKVNAQPSRTLGRPGSIPTVGGPPSSRGTPDSDSVIGPSRPVAGHDRNPRVKRHVNPNQGSLDLG